MKRAIAIVANPPIPGRTKSRLAAQTSPEFAAELSCAMLRDLIAESTMVPDTDVILFYPPDSSVDQFGNSADGITIFRKQSGHDLGARMYNCFDSLANDGYCQTVLIGSDCITHSAAGLEQAFHAVADADLVIQPAIDGGYVLIGMSVPNRSVFTGVQWGTETVMQTTRRFAEEATLTLHELPAAFDVDTADDLQRLRQFLLEHSRPNVASLLSSKTWYS